MKKKVLSPVQKNEIIELKIDAIGTEGQGIGKHEGYAIFVPGALPGETVRALIIKSTPGYAIGKLVEILQADPTRVEPRCSAFPKCGGCALQHLEYERQLQYKRRHVQDVLERIGGMRSIVVEPVMGMESPWNYRNKGSFPVRWADGRIAAGFFAPRSHRLIPINECSIQNGGISKTVRAVLDWAEDNNITPYDEASGSGIIRHIMVRQTSGGALMAVIVTTGALPCRSGLIKALTKSVEGLESIIHNIQAENTNVILGDRYHVIWGKEYIVDRICDLEFEVSAASFLQVNHAQTEKLYQEAVGSLELHGGESVADIYCGIGTITLMLAKHSAEVIGIESVEQAVLDAHKNAARNHITNVRFMCAQAEEALPSLVKDGLRLDAVVLDPPRKGCGEEALNVLGAAGAQRIAYISCNPATLARDCRILYNHGYSIRRIVPVDMFPQAGTGHIETLACLERR